MTTIVDKIRKRIKTRQMIEGKIIEEVQITTKEAGQLGNIKMIDNVKLIVVDKLKDKAREDCFAYINRTGHKSCYCLNKLYCVHEKCNFYRKDIKISEIERQIKKYEKNIIKKEVD